MTIQLTSAATDLIRQMQDKLTTKPTECEVISLALYLLVTMSDQGLTPVINGRATPLDLVITAMRQH